jgi:hypothetical protein
MPTMRNCNRKDEHPVGAELSPADGSTTAAQHRCWQSTRSETALPPLDSLSATLSSNRDRVRMVKSLRQWLQANELPAIIVGVLGALIALSMLLVLGGYLFVTR